MNQLDTFKTTPTKVNSQVDYILLDGSSSMSQQWWDTLDALQAYIDGVKAERIQSQCLVHVFDSTDKDYIARDVPIDQWQSMRSEGGGIGHHGGLTPLYDAVMLMGRRLRDMDPPRCSIVIITDGDENNSTFCDLTQAKNILDWCRAKGWQVTFIGANFANDKQAAALGANNASAIGVERKHLASAASNLAKKRARYGLYGTDMHFSDDEKQQFGGYLGHSK
jgi:hypothetical protein